MIRTEALTKFYGNRCAVRDLTVEIQSHEIVGFLGLNGAGKTTALRMLAGQLSPSAGKIEIDGHDTIAAGADMRWRIGFLPERPPLYDDMTVRSYLDFAARLRGTDPSAIDKRIEEVLELTHLKAYADEAISNLSHGFKQRVGIAQAIVHGPALVILDEPNNGLDPAQIKEMRALIRELKSRHTVLVSSHMLPEISQTCDRLMVIREGVLVAVGTEAELAGGGDARRYAIDVVGNAAAVDAVMRDLSDKKLVLRFENRAPSDERDVSGRPASDKCIELAVTLSEDRPEAVAAALIAAGAGLRRLEPIATELETLFLKLTHTRAS